MPSRVRNNAEKPGLAEATPHYLGHRERLRERFLDAGPDAVTEYELLELVRYFCLQSRDRKTSDMQGSPAHRGITLAPSGARTHNR